VAGPSLTPRESEVARLISAGLTNKEIGRKLGISERTVGAHVQNILNKLGAANRAQIAAWSAHAASEPRAPSSQAVPIAIASMPAAPKAQAPAPPWRIAMLLVLTLIVVGLFPLDHLLHLPSTVPHGALITEVQFDPDGREFTSRIASDDQGSASIRFAGGGLEYAVIRPGAWTGNKLVTPPRSAFVGEFEVSAPPDSKARLWVYFSPNPAPALGDVLVEVDFAVQTIDLAVLSEGVTFQSPDMPSRSISNFVLVPGLAQGRRFVLSVVVTPPHYAVYVDDDRIIDGNHLTYGELLTPGFLVNSDQVGTAMLDAVRIYEAPP
jgi:DNA-binding CsgD family transcriptional regulator